MSLDLAVWVGPRPADDEAATREFERWCASIEDEDHQPAPASPSIAAFLADILRQFPALGEPDDENSPWVVGPEPGDVDGDFAYLNLAFSTEEATLDAIVATAGRHGLVCYDPQTEGLA